MMQLDALLARISDLAADATVDLGETTELLMSGLIDSLGIMNLVAWIEDEISVEIDPGDVVIENFETPAAILAFCTSLAPTS